MLRQPARFLLPILLVFIVNTTAFAQSQNSILSGTVQDTNGAIVENARVRLLDAVEKIVAEVQADGEGRFQLRTVVAGSYTLRVTKNGMAETNEKIVVAADSIQSLAITLSPKSLQETVTVSSGDGDSLAVESVTVTKTAAPLRDLPQSVEIVGQKLLEQQNARSLQDALYNVTAVTVAQGEGRRDQFLIRGFSALGDQFVDGVRDDAPYYRDLANVERIEVVKGPAAVLFGRGSSGGLINRVTKRPNFSRRVGGIEFSGGSYGLKRTAIDYGQPFFGDKLSFRFVGAYENSGGFRQNSFLNRYNVAPSLGWRPNEKTDVSLQFEYLNDQRLPDRGIPAYGNRPAAVDINTYYGFPVRDGITNRVAAQTVKFERRLTNVWQVRNVFRHTGYGTNFHNTGASGVCVFALSTICNPLPLGKFAAVNSKLGVTRFTYNSSSKQNNFFNQTETVGVFNALGWQHTVLAGVEFGSQERRTATFRNNNANAVGLLNPDLTGLLTTGNFTVTRNDFDATTTGFYVQDQINFTRQLKALVGARYDRFEQKLDDLQSRLKTADFSRVDRSWSPRVGVVYQPTEWLSLYTSYTRSFQPSGENLSLAANNTELKPEMTRNYEAGVKATIPQFRLNTTLSVFRLDRDNIKTTDPNNSTLLLLVGEQRTDGIEATINGSPVKKLEITAGYALLSARILRSNNLSSGVSLQGRRAGLVPQSSGNLWINYALPKQFRVGFGAFARSDTFTSANNLVTLPGFIRFDASLAWRSEKHYEIAFNLRNLANSRYYETSNGDNGILPGSPINGSVTLRYRW